jgi:hypothetical protein
MVQRSRPSVEGAYALTSRKFGTRMVDLNELWIPVAAGFVGGLLPAAVAWRASLSNERMNRGRIEAERLAAEAEKQHETASELRQTAVEAYTALREMQIAFLPALIRHDHEYPESNDSLVSSTVRQLSELHLFGWNEAVRRAAGACLVTVDRLWDLHQVHWLSGSDEGTTSYVESEASLLSLVDEALPESRRALRVAVGGSADKLSG